MEKKVFVKYKESENLTVVLFCGFIDDEYGRTKLILLRGRRNCDKMNYKKGCFYG